VYLIKFLEAGKSNIKEPESARSGLMLQNTVLGEIKPASLPIPSVFFQSNTWEKPSYGGRRESERAQGSGRAYPLPRQETHSRNYHESIPHGLIAS
jgi:hypothetical protein